MRKGKINKICLYLVDADPLIRKILESKFKQNFDYELFLFSYGEDFLQHIISTPTLKWNLNIIILDHNLNLENNKKDAMEIIKYTKEILPKAHIILLSSYLTDKIEEKARLLNLNTCIKKNENSFLRIQNVVNEIVSEHEIKRQKKYTLTLLFIFLALIAIMGIVVLFNF